MTGHNLTPNGIDTKTPNVARIYDYLLGGKDNFAADRKAAKRLIEAIPDVDGFELVEPGLTWIAEWRPEPGTAPTGRAHSMRGGVGRKP